MAIEVFPDSPSVGLSPRISFSHDLSQTDVVPVEQYIGSSSSSSLDFDFCVFRESFVQESSLADELFFDGKILPIEIKKRLAPAALSKKTAPPVSPLAPPLPPPIYNQILDSSKSSKKSPTESDEKQHSSKSFWRFKRSTSLNCGSGYARTLCPLPILSRSNSTGSASSSKRSSVKQSQFVSPNSNTTHQRPPLKKTHASAYASINGIRINPVLNVPPANLFGFSSIFSGGKDKNKNKNKKKSNTY
ncbi:uncharacterized protein LOC111407986 isoform X1 [Olea europaea var. sylvestris]|uniref:Uncharacterized protein n=2 Tax=Olea europaea subsp. europaea TaxID=158383 RepID=A0A8S0SQC9_OLEEU|nr:uncharacterized protein LOC111407986 isoform X1 [Olea europaea var. sylvestris]CAA2994905.1 Hypothetical predicted protein [Olea europaea subsp. europaea]